MEKPNKYWTLIIITLFALMWGIAYWVFIAH